MSNKELIAEARAFASASPLGKPIAREMDKAILMVRRLADALEARQPSGDDRDVRERGWKLIALLNDGDENPEYKRGQDELLAYLTGCLCYGADGVTEPKCEVCSRATVPDAATEAKQPEGWSNEDAHAAADQAFARWSTHDERDVWNRNGFRLGAEWQKARETFISFKAIADESRAERDAALAAVERVRATVDGPHPANSGLDSFTLAHISAALDGAPEPEWEVQYGRRNRETGALHWLTGDPSDDWWHENQDRYEHVKRYTSPPLPVEGESK